MDPALVKDAVLSIIAVALITPVLLVALLFLAAGLARRP